MITEIDKLQRLIAENKIDKALQILSEEVALNPDFQNQLYVINAKFNDVRKKENMGMLGNSELFTLKAQVNYSLLELLNEIEKTKSELPDAVTENKVTAYKNVFISYNHNDAAIAQNLKEKLQASQIKVIIDSEGMQAGEDIKDFIEHSVKETETTLSIVSKTSLLSAWVAMESINSFYHEKTNSTKKFIACFITDDFFNREFTDDALDYIENEIKDLQKLITSRMEKNRSIRDLQNELTRLTDLRNNMDEIIRRLRESLCIDIRAGNLDKNFQKIIDAIHS